MWIRAALTAVALTSIAASAHAQGGPPPPPLNPIPPPPVPAANPQSSSKIVLGKFLFWDAQLSSDDSVACGTCHLPEFGGSDPRSMNSVGVNPGFDGVFGTADDIGGSPGVSAELCGVGFEAHPIFGDERQVTGRKTPTMIGAAYSTTLFWDGRATGQFLDPETGALVIGQGGALESQAVEPILSTIEMSCDGRTWEDVRNKLEFVEPAGLALSRTPDMNAALTSNPDYPSLFQAAFGTADITAARIGMALASYQRTLVPNQAPFDAFITNGPSALTPLQNQGNQLFAQNCLPCHGGALQTDNQFHNVGVRPLAEDTGRQDITGNPADAGRFKTPTLRNVGLRAPYFHNGGKTTLLEVVQFYNNGGDFLANQSPLIQPLGLNPGQINAIVHFLDTALTDPRVEQKLPPFDHPELRPYFRRGDTNGDDNFNIADPIGTLDYLFLGSSIACQDSADSNDDGNLDIGDVISSLSRIFTGAAPLPAPSEVRRGPDPTEDSLDCDA